MWRFCPLWQFGAASSSSSSSTSSAHNFHNRQSHQNGGVSSAIRPLNSVLSVARVFLPARRRLRLRLDRAVKSHSDFKLARKSKEEKSPNKSTASGYSLVQGRTSEAMENDEQKVEIQQNEATVPSPSSPPLSKTAKKKLLKQQRFEAKKAEKKAAMKEQKKLATEVKKKEWEEKLASMPEEEKLKLVEARKGLRKERMGKRSEEKDKKLGRLNEAKESGQNIVVDLEFSHLMTPSEIHSLVQQIMYCYAVNAKCNTPGHLWLTGCEGEMGTHLNKLPGYDKWIIEKENRPYIETFNDKKGDLVYLTADSETVLDDLDPTKIYIVGGLVDRNRWKGITMKKAVEQGIQTAKLPIGNYLKMSSSQVLTVNQVMEILLRFVETRDWKTSFFQVIPPRKRREAEIEADDDNSEDGEKMKTHQENGESIDDLHHHPERKRPCFESASLG